MKAFEAFILAGFVAAMAVTAIIFIFLPFAIILELCGGW